MPNTEQEAPHFQHRVAAKVSPLGRTQVTAPCDGRLIATVDEVGADGIELALDTADRLFDDRNTWLPVDRRMAILSRTAGLLEERAEAFAREAAREGGKPLIDSRVEVARAVDAACETARSCCALRPGWRYPWG